MSNYNEVTAYGIFKALKSVDCMITFKSIASRMKVDPTSENLLLIRDECFDYVEAGSVMKSDFRREKGGELFFGMS